MNDAITAEMIACRSSSKPLRWLHLVPFAVALGFVTFLFAMMSHDISAALEIIRQRLDEGMVWPILWRRWMGPDLASAAAFTGLFAILWLVPAILVRRVTTSRAAAIWFMAMLTTAASVVIFVLAVGSFLLILANTIDRSNAWGWSSPRAALLSLIVLAPCVVAALWTRRRT